MAITISEAVLECLRYRRQVSFLRPEYKTAALLLLRRVWR